MDKTPVADAAHVATTTGASIVVFKMDGPNMTATIGFEDNAPFDPRNPSHLLGWYVHKHGAEFLPAAYEEMKQTLAAGKAALDKNEVIG